MLTKSLQIQNCKQKYTTIRKVSKTILFYKYIASTQQAEKIQQSEQGGSNLLRTMELW